MALQADAEALKQRRVESREEPGGSRSSKTTESSRAEGGALSPKGGAPVKKGKLQLLRTLSCLEPSCSLQ